jgi:hypothetical protein
VSAGKLPVSPAFLIFSLISSKTLILILITFLAARDSEKVVKPKRRRKPLKPYINADWSK